MKRCTKCKEFKRLEEYHKRSSEPDGYNYTCKECVLKQKREYYLRTTEEHKERARKWKKENPERAAESMYKAGIKYRKNNPEKYKASCEKYRKANLHKDAENAARRRAKVKQATLGDFKEELQEIYKNRPEGYHVDHIVPLNGKTVSGLHVPWNLQYLPAKENIKKGNKLDKEDK